MGPAILVDALELRMAEYKAKPYQDRPNRDDNYTM
jgi:hypothetical protein